MAVIASQRKPGKLETLTAARELARYTFTITKNETQFPRHDRWMLTQEIVRETAAILGHMQDIQNNYNSWRANAQRGNTRNLLKQMDAYYTDLIGQPPGWPMKKEAPP